MTDILDLPDWTLLAKRHVGDEYELEAECPFYGSLRRRGSSASMVYGPVAGPVRKEAKMGKIKEQELVLLRGLPGSGKTWTAVNRFAPDGYVHCEADHFFEVRMPSGATAYNYNRMLVGRAHAHCQNRVREALRAGKSVVVANTFVRRYEMEPYLLMADHYQVPVRIITMRGCFQSVHDVPQHKLDEMRRNFEE